MARKITVEFEGTQIPVVNPDDVSYDETVWDMQAGAYADVRVLVFAQHLEDALEVFVEWLDDNKPGCLTTIDYDAAAKELGFDVDHLSDQEEEKIYEHAEVDMYVVGHTTLKHGNAIPSYEWWGKEASSALADLTRAACSTVWGFGGGQLGCLYDHQEYGYTCKEDAVGAVADAYSLYAQEESELESHGVVFFDEERAREVGFAYIELYEVDA